MRSRIMPPAPVDRRPRLRNAWPYLAQVAADLHAKRVAGYPDQVAHGRMTQTDADAAIHHAAAIAEDWRIAAAGGVIDHPPTQQERRERIATLRIARDLTATRADRAGHALRQLLPAGTPMPERDVLMVDRQHGATLSPAVEAWIHATDYAAAIVALLWWEERRGGRLDVVCAINAGWRAEQTDVQADARREAA